MNLSTKLIIGVKTGIAMSINENPKVADVPLDEIDVSRPEIFLNDSWQPWFERLRREAPVHYLADSVNGPFWSDYHRQCRLCAGGGCFGSHDDGPPCGGRTE